MNLEDMAIIGVLGLALGYYKQGFISPLLVGAAAAVYFSISAATSCSPSLGNLFCILNYITLVSQALTLFLGPMIEGAVISLVGYLIGRSLKRGN